MNWSKNKYFTFAFASLIAIQSFGEESLLKLVFPNPFEKDELTLQATEGKGGQFVFSSDPTSLLPVANAQREILSRMASLSQEKINEVFSYKNVDKNRFIAALSNLKYNLTCIRIRVNPKGKNESVMLDFGPRPDAPVFEENCEKYPDNKDRVEILEKFATLVQLNRFTDLQIQEHLVHETLHVFHYDQGQASEYAKKYMSHLRLDEAGGFVLRANENVLNHLHNLIDEVNYRIYTTYVGGRKVFRNGCGDDLVISYDSLAQTFVLRDPANGEEWYVTDVRSLGGDLFAVSFELTKKDFVDTFMTRYGKNKLIKGELFNVIWASSNQKTSVAHALYHPDSEIISVDMPEKKHCPDFKGR